MTRMRESSHLVITPSQASLRAMMRVEKISPKVTISSAGDAAISAKSEWHSASASALSAPVNSRRIISR